MQNKKVKNEKQKIKSEIKINDKNRKCKLIKNKIYLKK